MHDGGLPVDQRPAGVEPRTTFSDESYERVFFFPSYDTVAFTLNGTSAPEGAPAVSVVCVMCASSCQPFSAESAASALFV